MADPEPDSRILAQRMQRHRERTGPRWPGSGQATAAFVCVWMAKWSHDQAACQEEETGAVRCAFSGDHRITADVAGISCWAASRLAKNLGEALADREVARLSTGILVGMFDACGSVFLRCLPPASRMAAAMASTATVRTASMALTLPRQLEIRAHLIWLRSPRQSS